MVDWPLNPDTSYSNAEERTITVCSVGERRGKMSSYGISSSAQEDHTRLLRSGPKAIGHDCEANCGGGSKRKTFNFLSLLPGLPCYSLASAVCAVQTEKVPIE